MDKDMTAEALPRREIVINIKRNMCWTVTEFSKVINTLPVAHPLRVAMLIAFLLGLRASEIADLRFNCFNDDMSKITYKIYKPRNTRNKCSVTSIYKENTKPVYSSFLRDELRVYRRLHQGTLFDNKLFPMKDGKGLSKRWERYRNQLVEHPEFKFLEDETHETLVGNHIRSRRCNFHALRRANFTFYWHNSLYADKDIVKMMLWSGHSNFNTLLNHYIKNPHDIGLSVNDLECGLTFDDFFKLTPRGQRFIKQYMPKREISIPKIKKGQTQLFSFLKEKRRG